MNRSRTFLRFAIQFAMICGFARMQAPAAAQSFTVSASNATLPANGSGTVAFSVTSVNGFSGNVQISCGPTSIPAGARLPFCGGNVAPMIYAVPANAAVTGNLALFGSPLPCSNPCPVRLDRAPADRKGAGGGLALAGALLVGLGLRRRAVRWFALMLLAAGTLAGAAGISACGGSSSGPTLTAGVWPYTIAAADTSTNVTVSTTFDVTVPAGIRGSGLE
jgi:hypothetical protein